MKEPRPRILLVDDEPVNIQILEIALRGDCELVSAHDGPSALRLAREERPDLVLLDVMMPEMDGFEVCAQMKADAELAPIPVIFITALDRMIDELKGLSLGAIDYIFKPINPLLVKCRVRNQLELKRQRDLLSRQKQKLEEALSRLRTLEGIIPICMYCNKIRDDRALWQKIEDYISEHSNARFSHGVCPDCIDKFKQELDNRKKKP